MLARALWALAMVAPPGSGARARKSPGEPTPRPPVQAPSVDEHSSGGFVDVLLLPCGGK